MSDVHSEGQPALQLPFLNLDIEPTNRCNAHCYFCPRDQTPHQGLMTPEVFDRALERTIEFGEITRVRFGTRIKVNLCGLGEPLLNRNTPDFVRKVHDAGFEISVSSNGSLLDEKRGAALLEAGLQGIEINAGDEGERLRRDLRIAVREDARQCRALRARWRATSARFASSW